MPDIEFLDEHGDAPAPDAPRPAPRRPAAARRVGVLVALIVLALVVVAVTAHRRGGHPAALPSSDREPVRTPVRTAAPLRYTPVGSLLFGNVFDASDSQLLAAGDRLFALGPDELGESDLRGLHTVVEQLPTLDQTGDRSYRLVDDPAHHRLWVVPIGGDYPGILRGYSDVDLGPGFEIGMPGPVVGTALLDGALYLSTGTRVYEVTGGRTLERVPISGTFGPITADPARHRLLFLTTDRGVVSWTPRTRRLDATESPHGVTIDGSAVDELFTVGGGLWGSADQAGDTVYAPLDAGTFAPDLTRAVSTQVGSDVVVATPSRFLLRGTNTGSVSCVDAVTGRVLTRWAGLPGPLAAFDGQVLSIAPNGLVTVPSDGCF